VLPKISGPIVVLLSKGARIPLIDRKITWPSSDR
jgi:hypothetical protein